MPVGCIGSKIAFLCGVVHFPHMSYRVVRQFSAFFQLCYCFFVVIVVGITVWIRGIGGTVFVSGIILNIFSLFLLFFQRATMISVMSWFFTVVARWFGSVGISVCGLLAHLVDR